MGHLADPELDLREVKPKQLCVVAFLPHILDSKVSTVKRRKQGAGVVGLVVVPGLPKC